MPRASKAEARKMTAVKFAPDLQQRIDAVANELTRRTSGAELPTSIVMTQIVSRGLDVYERELGLATP